MKNAELVALVKSLQQEIVTLKAARTTRKPSDFKILVTTEIPSAKGKWGTVEITDNATGEVIKCFHDHTHNAKDRTDGAKQVVIYATRMSPTSESAPSEPAPARDEDIAFGQE